MSGQPLDVLESAVDDEVTVRLKSGEAYTGTLSGYDQHMNLVLEDVVDAFDAEPESPQAVEDTTIIRGDNVVSIHP